MLHVSMVGDASAAVDATLITIEDAALVCRSAAGEEPVARYGLEQVLSVQLVQPLGVDPEPEPEREGRRVSSRTSPEHPNAFRRWTVEQEGAVVDAYHRGDTFEQITAAAGRRVAGVRARLIALGVIEPEATDRLRFPVGSLAAKAGEPG